MPRIAILPEHLANRIAAGEVIQRPASAVKELIENSLDAGATSVAVQIRDGGTSFLQVADNGSGMDEEDAILSFQRHATSKITSDQDLEAIVTFGFRGEALASMASVARVTLLTRRAEDAAGVVVRIDGGGEPKVSHEARDVGTTVTVQNLFFNVPARKKFLKSHATEFRHVHEVLVRAALGHPERSFSFSSDGEVIFRLAPGTVADRVRDLFGERQLGSLLELEETLGPITLRGFVGKPSFGQRNRSAQYLFLNRRPIQSRSISYAVQKAYEHLLQEAMFPFFVLFLEIDPHRVDVNVHPSKLEAKFEDEPSVYRFINAAVRRSLSSLDHIPSLTASGTGDTVALAFTRRQHEWTDTSVGGVLNVDRATGEILQGAEVAGRLLAGAGPLDGETPSGTMAPVWQLHRRYLLTPIEQGLLVADQHVVHERILYEQIVRRMAGGERVSQQLLFPLTLELPADDLSLLREMEQVLVRMGFDFKFFGGNTVVVEGLPPEAAGANQERILEDVLALYRDFSVQTASERVDTVAKSLACRSAVKSGDVLSETEMRRLIADLAACSMPYACPHGRPVVLRISLEELDRRFSRR